MVLHFIPHFPSSSTSPPPIPLLLLSIACSSSSHHHTHHHLALFSVRSRTVINSSCVGPMTFYTANNTASFSYLLPDFPLPSPHLPLRIAAIFQGKAHTLVQGVHLGFGLMYCGLHKPCTHPIETYIRKWRAADNVSYCFLTLFDYLLTPSGGKICCWRC